MARPESRSGASTISVTRTGIGPVVTAMRTGSSTGSGCSVRGRPAPPACRLTRVADNCRGRLRDRGHLTILALPTWGDSCMERSPRPTLLVMRKNRVLQPYAIADGRTTPGPERPDRGDPHGRAQTQPANPTPAAVDAGRGRAGGRPREPGPAPASTSDLHASARRAAPTGRLRPVHRRRLPSRGLGSGPQRGAGLRAVQRHVARARIQ